MKEIILFAICILSFSGYAQLFDWASTGGYIGVANSYSGAIDIARDSQGNVYTIDLGNAPQQCQDQTATPFGSNTNTFLYKFNTMGELVYMKAVGPLFYPLNIEVGDDDSLYLLGANGDSNTVQINAEIISTVINRNYVLKLDAGGELVWATATPSSFYATGSSMLQYANEAVYFQTGATEVGKMSIEGIVDETLAADSFTSPTSANGISFKGSGTFSNGDLLFAALSRGTITYGDTVLAPLGNTFLTMPLMFLRCDENLNIIWVGYFDGYRDPEMNVIPIDISAADDIYATVQVNSEATIGGDTVVNPPGSTYTSAVVKIDAEGEGIWAKQFGQSVHPWDILDIGDGSGLFIAGQLSGTGLFGDISLNNTNGNSFISKIDYSGTFASAFVFGSTSAYNARSLSSDGGTTFYVGGRMDGANVDPVFSCETIDGNAGFYIGKFTEEPDSAPQPLITFDQSILTATPPFEGEIQWFLDGVEIAEATGHSIIATVSGNYSVTYTIDEGCMNSETAAVAVLSTDDFHAVASFRLYPNPSHGIFQINGNVGIRNIEVTNALGETVRLIKNYHSGDVVDLRDVSNGLYFVNIESDAATVVAKLLKN